VRWGFVSWRTGAFAHRPAVPRPVSGNTRPARDG
jgi:hypothetical protein